MPVVISRNCYVWEFARPHEVELIAGVPGRQHLWRLSADVAALLAEGEARSRRGEWNAPGVQRERRRESLEAWRKTWETDVARLARRLQKEALNEVEMKFLETGDTQAEKWFRGGLRELLGKRAVKDANGAIYVRAEKRFQPLFGGRARSGGRVRATTALCRPRGGRTGASDRAMSHARRRHGGPTTRPPIEILSPANP